MLAKTREKLQSYIDNKPQFGIDGQLREMDGVTKIGLRQCERIADLHRTIRPDLSVETGLAYGFSTIPMLDSMEEHAYGHHIAIDPSQHSYWQGVALKSIDDLGLSGRFTWLETTSDSAFLRLRDEGTRAGLIFFDGLHSFDGIIADVFLADQILETGGLLIFNYNWMPVGRAVKSFMANNLLQYEPYPTGHEIMFAFRKVAEDQRPWNHFVAFDGSGSEPTQPGRWRKLLGRA